MAKLLLGTLIGIIVPQILRILGRLTLTGHFQWADCDLSTVVRLEVFSSNRCSFWRLLASPQQQSKQKS